MRLLLDVHLSDEKVGDPLRVRGHDVLAAEKDDGLRRLDDEPLLEWALPQRRIVVTANVRDFLPIISRRLSQGRPHAGCILIPGSVKNNHYGTLISGVGDLVGSGSQEDWWKRTLWLPA